MSQRFVITRALSIFQLTMEQWDFPKHSHNFFELVFVKSGRGQHQLNDSVSDYKRGDIFLLTPKDVHQFEIKKTSTFGFIKFTELLFLEKRELLNDSKWRKNIDHVMQYTNPVAVPITKDGADSQQLFRLFEMMKIAFEKPTPCRFLLLELFGALLILVAKQITQPDVLYNEKSPHEKNQINDILSHIRRNILNPEKINTKTIADQFYMSPNYVSIFIKKHIGISMKQYVIQTRIKMAERLLKQSGLSVSEIAEKTGFNDSSHFNKLFKKYVGMTPSQYLKS